MNPELFTKLGAEITEMLSKPFEGCMHFLTTHVSVETS